jgi:membrane-associated phospholipid phosphatase
MDGQAQPISLRPRYVHLRNWCMACVITAAGVIAAYIWLDRPIALFIDRTVSDKTLFVWLQRLPLALLLLSLLMLVWCGLWTLMERPFLRVQSVGLACSISFIAANFISDQLKYALGRTWPDTWIQNNPSLIQNGVFGFNPFHGGPGFASFPSGHVAAVCAAITVLWWSYRRLRPICLVFVAAVAIGLIGANYHFLSDILGGIFVGTSVGYITKEIARGKLFEFTQHYDAT